MKEDMRALGPTEMQTRFWPIFISLTPGRSEYDDRDQKGKSKI
jgi:hypothetical protein